MLTPFHRWLRPILILPPSMITFDRMWSLCTPTLYFVLATVDFYSFIMYYKHLHMKLVNLKLCHFIFHIVILYWAMFTCFVHESVLLTWFILDVYFVLSCGASGFYCTHTVFIYSRYCASRRFAANDQRHHTLPFKHVDETCSVSIGCSKRVWWKH